MYVKQGFQRCLTGQIMWQVAGKVKVAGKERASTLCENIMCRLNAGQLGVKTLKTGEAGHKIFTVKKKGIIDLTWGQELELSGVKVLPHSQTVFVKHSKCTGSSNIFDGVDVVHQISLRKCDWTKIFDSI